MATYTHQTAPTQFTEAAGIRFAYRRLSIPTLATAVCRACDAVFWKMILSIKVQ